LKRGRRVAPNATVKQDFGHYLVPHAPL
jgi:hypothetical protein